MNSFMIRQLQDELIDVINKYPTIPNEVKRLVLDYVLHLVCKKADEDILAELGKEEDNAESIQ